MSRPRFFLFWLALALAVAFFIGQALAPEAPLYAHPALLYWMGAVPKLAFGALAVLGGIFVTSRFTPDNPSRLAWWLWTAGCLGTWVGQAILAVYFTTQGDIAVFPSVADPFFVAGSLALAASLFAFVRVSIRSGFSPLSPAHRWTIGGSFRRELVQSKYALVSTKQNWRVDRSALTAGDSGDSGWMVNNQPAGFRKLMELRRSMAGKKGTVSHLVFRTAWPRYRYSSNLVQRRRKSRRSGIRAGFIFTPAPSLVTRSPCWVRPRRKPSCGLRVRWSPGPRPQSSSAERIRCTTRSPNPGYPSCISRKG